jgi:hypothetical protein
MGSRSLALPGRTPAARRARHAVALLAAWSLGGCGAESEDAQGEDGGTEACAAPNRLVGGECREPGVQDNGCPAGSWLAPDGNCQPAGIPPEACAEGFVPTAEGGCEPILPEEPCPAGLMALPGETECHEVMPCGAGRWAISRSTGPPST